MIEKWKNRDRKSRSYVATKLQSTLGPISARDIKIPTHVAHNGRQTHKVWHTDAAPCGSDLKFARA